MKKYGILVLLYLPAQFTCLSVRFVTVEHVAVVCILFDRYGSVGICRRTQTEEHRQSVWNFSQLV